jgi:hypothetical protein
MFCGKCIHLHIVRFLLSQILVAYDCGSAIQLLLVCGLIKYLAGFGEDGIICVGG